MENKKIAGVQCHSLPSELRIPSDVVKLNDYCFMTLLKPSILYTYHTLINKWTKLINLGCAVPGNTSFAVDYNRNIIYMFEISKNRGNLFKLKYNAASNTISNIQQIELSYSFNHRKVSSIFANGAYHIFASTLNDKYQHFIYDPTRKKLDVIYQFDGYNYDNCLLYMKSKNKLLVSRRDGIYSYSRRDVIYSYCIDTNKWSMETYDEWKSHSKSKYLCQNDKYLMIKETYNSMIYLQDMECLSKWSDIKISLSIENLENYKLIVMVHHGITELLVTAYFRSIYDKNGTENVAILPIEIMNIICMMDGDKGEFIHLLEMNTDQRLHYKLNTKHFFD